LKKIKNISKEKEPSLFLNLILYCHS